MNHSQHNQAQAKQIRQGLRQGNKERPGCDAIDSILKRNHTAVQKDLLMLEPVGIRGTDMYMKIIGISAAIAAV